MTKNSIISKIYTAIHGTPYKSRGEIPQKARDLMNFLEQNYGFYDVTFITTHVYNTFLLAMDQNNRMLFVKSGRHPELYRNEYIMGRILWEMDKEHFLEPLYYSDKDPFYFFANEIMYGDSLQRFSASGKLDAMSENQKMSLIRDLYQIFIDLKKSDVVHRDIRPENFAVINDKLVLIDFQLAVFKSNYREFESMSVGRLRGLGTKKYRYKLWHWDDAYSLWKCARFIGCPGAQYRREYNDICKEIKSYVGHDTIKSSKREGFIQRVLRHLRKKRSN